MTISPEVLLNLLWSLFLTLAGLGGAWLINRIFKIMDDLKKEDATLHERITKLQSESSNVFARRDDMKDLQQQLLATMRRLEDKIDHLVDNRSKPNGV